MTEQKLQVWWIPQIPMKSFKVDVYSVTEAVRIMNVLANYDLFQYENNVKPDYSNMGGLDIWNEEEQEFWSWDIDFDVTINGERYSEYFEEPEEFLEFLYQNNLTEQQIYNAMNIK